jgi:hypothetical protein
MSYYRVKLLIGVFLSVAISGGMASAQERSMVAELRGGQEVPPVATDAFGSGRFIVDTAAQTVTYHISFTGLSSDETGAHIHGPAGPGQNAGVVHNLGTGNPKVGVWSYDPAHEADLLAGRMYVNVHSQDHPGGEIRGQINDFAMTMDGGQENPAVASSGTGWGTFNLDTCSKELRYYIVIESLDFPETAAHIHGLALPGDNAGVLLNLGTGNLKTGTWNYPPELETAIVNGMTYVNVHSEAYPGGEIRGQVVRTVVPQDGQQEVPPVGTGAAGNGLIAFDVDSHTLGYYFTFANLSSIETGAFIHGPAEPGENAPVQHNLGTGSPKKGQWNYGAVTADTVMDGRTYINISSTNFTTGEIRGQIVPATDPLPDPQIFHDRFESEPPSSECL